MGNIVKLECKAHRHAAEQTVFGLECDTRALERLANDGATFFGQEVSSIRRAAYDLLNVARQVEANMLRGSK